MVLLWTQHEGERLEPQPTDEQLLQSPCKDDKDNLKPSSSKAPGDAAAVATTSSSSPVPTIRVEDLSVVVEAQPPSEKHVVTLRQVSDVIKRSAFLPSPSPSAPPSSRYAYSSASSIASSSSVFPSPASSPSSPPSHPRSPPQLPPSSSPSALEGAIVEEISVDTLEVASSSAECVTRLPPEKTATLGPATSLEGDEEEGGGGGAGGRKKKQHKRKFYTLPRNWRSKAADFILTKGTVTRLERTFLVAGWGQILILRRSFVRGPFLEVLWSRSFGRGSFLEVLRSRSFS
ncbi:NADPH oxidase activator-like [Penaeus japonicus]|uniref:NADPH oxidase activator-like n=1 Tax=Penaeus japonicus TaxID=27405 RepID=UPI001C71148E|nr:NADPH oxidase activator-like [Penaeus japonicus]